MPDVTLTLAAEDQASGILDRIVNSVEDLTNAVSDQVGVYADFQQEIIQKQERAEQAVRERVDNEKRVFESIKDILDKTERLYRNHAEAMEAINQRMRTESGTIEAQKEYQRQVADDKTKIKQLEDTVKRESDIRKSDLEKQKDVNDERKHQRQMAFQEQVVADKMKLSQMNSTANKEAGIRGESMKNQEHLITAEQHLQRMEYQRQVARDARGIKRLTQKNKKEDEKLKRGLENRKNAIDREKHLRRTEYQAQTTADRRELKQLDETIKQKDHERRKDLENIRQSGRKEMQMLRQQQRERERLMGGGLGGRRRGRGGIGGASDVFTGILYADLFGVGIQEIQALGDRILQATIKIQGMIFGLQAVEGSAEAAAKQLDRIIEIAKLPGIQLEPAIKATVTLRALKLEGELVERTIMAIGNALATLGREGELGGVVLALSQIVGKGKIHAEEINQIAERLPLIRGILVEEFGTANTEVLQKMELEIEDFVERITQGLERLPKVATQIGTSFKNLQNQIFLFTAQIGTFFKEELMDVIDWVTDRLETANATLKFVNKRNEELGRQQKVIEEAQAITVRTDTASGLSPEMANVSRRIQEIYSSLDPAERQAQANRAREQYYQGVGANTDFTRMLSDMMSGGYMQQFDQMAQLSESERQKLIAELPQAEKQLMDLMQTQKEAMDALKGLSYEDLKKNTLALDKAIRERARILGLGDEGRREEYRGQLDQLRKQLDDADMNPMARQFAYGEVMGSLAERYILSPDQIQQMESELEGWRRSLALLGQLSTNIIQKHREKLKNSSEAAAKAAELELQIYNEKIAKIVSAEIVPELDPGLEGRIRRVAESSDLAVGIDARVLGLQEQFNAAVGVGLDSLLRSVDNQVERDMAKIARNIKPIAERLKPEIAALKTRAEREAEYDKVLVDIRKQMETIAELHKQSITEYYNSLVEMEFTFKRWLSETGGAAQISPQLQSRIDRLAESQMIQDAIGLQMEGLSTPFNRVREYAIDTLTNTIQGDTEKQLQKLREDVLKIAKATHPDFHTYTPEQQTAVFNELFEQRAPAIRASEKALIDTTTDRFNAILDIHLEFRQWYEETVGKDRISPQLEGMVRQVTQRGDFQEAVLFRVEGFETTFQNERGRMIQGIQMRIQKDAQRALKDAAAQAHNALIAHSDYQTMSTQQRSAEWTRIYNQLAAPIQTGIGVSVKNAIEQFDRVIEVQTVYNEWLKSVGQTPFLSDADRGRLQRAVKSDEMQIGMELDMAGMTEQFQSVKQYALRNLVESINSDAQKQIAKESENVLDIVMADPTILEMSRTQIQEHIKKVHDKRIEVINTGRDLAIENVQAEFENLSRQEAIFRRALSQTTGQSKMQREIRDDVQKVIRGGDVQKAFEAESRFEPFSRDFDDIVNKGLGEVYKQIDRDSKIDMERRMGGVGDAVRSRLGEGAGLTGFFGADFEEMFLGSQVDQFRQEQQAIVNAQNELRKAQAEQIYREEIEAEKKAHQEKHNVKRENDRIDVLEDNRVREQIRQAETRYHQSVQDSALSAANNVISAWQQVSAQTDTMVDDVVGAVATIALQITEMLLTIQRTSAATSAAGQATGLLGQFATGLGIAGIALGAAATVYSFVDNRDDDRNTRNRISRSRPKTISHR